VPDVNLLPGDQRDRERKEQELIKKAPKKIEIALTNPPKDPKISVLPPAHLAKLSIWERLFGAPKKPKPVLSAKPPVPISASPSLLPTPPAKKVVAPIHSGASHEPWWKALFGSKPAAPKLKAPVPPTPVPPVRSERTPPIAPNLLRGVPSMPSPFVLPPTPPGPKPLPPAPAKVPTPPMPIRSAPPAPQVVATGTIAPIPSPAFNKSSLKFTKPEKEKEPEKKTVTKDSVTLLPEEFRPREAQIETKLVATVLGSVVVAAATVAAVLFVLSLIGLAVDNDLETARRAADEIVRSINQKADIRAQGEDLQKKIGISGQLLDRHLYWTKWLSVLEGHTNREVQWTRMEVDALSRSVQLEGLGKSMTAVAQQIVAWRETPAVESVTVTAVSGGESKTSGLVQGALPVFSFSATIAIKDHYTQEMPDPEVPDKTLSITRGVITTTRQEAEIDSKAAQQNAVSFDMKELFESAP